MAEPTPEQQRAWYGQTLPGAGVAAPAPGPTSSPAAAPSLTSARPGAGELPGTSAPGLPYQVPSAPADQLRDLTGALETACESVVTELLDTMVAKAIDLEAALAKVVAAILGQLAATLTRQQDQLYGVLAQLAAYLESGAAVNYQLLQQVGREAQLTFPLEELTPAPVPLPIVPGAPRGAPGPGRRRQPAFPPPPPAGGPGGPGPAPIPGGPPPGGPVPPSPWPGPEPGPGPAPGPGEGGPGPVPAGPGPPQGPGPAPGPSGGPPPGSGGPITGPAGLGAGGGPRAAPSPPQAILPGPAAAPQPCPVPPPPVQLPILSSGPAVPPDLAGLVSLSQAQQQQVTVTVTVPREYVTLDVTTGRPQLTLPQAPPPPLPPPPPGCCPTPQPWNGAVSEWDTPTSFIKGPFDEEYQRAVDAWTGGLSASARAAPSEADWVASLAATKTVPPSGGKASDQPPAGEGR